MSRRRFIALSVVLDAIFVNAGFLLAFLLRFGGTLPAFNFRPYILLAPLITVAYVVSNYINGVYEPEQVESAWDLVRGTVAGTALGTLLTLSALYVAGPAFQPFPRLVIAIAWPMQFTLLIGWRLVFQRVSRVAFPEQRVLVVGSSALAVELASELSARGRWGFRVLGLVEPAPRAECTPPKECGGFPVLGCVDEVAALAGSTQANRVIVTSPVALRELVEGLALADEASVRIDVVPELYEIFIGTVDAIVGDVPLMEITHATVPEYYAAVKRLIDLASAV
ncbi:MAG: hypothetical protein HY876_02570, partial [Coriobacteriales bacterium]|nr:hypothetical protein [Coriobacteriales bacterium]